MGYTTDFEGKFDLNKKLDIETFLRFKNVLNENRLVYKENGFDLDSYCQWTPNKDASAIQWDGGEKFYDYVECLRYLIEIELAPKGYVLNGSVKWRGEEFSDTGTIVVVDNKITVVKNEMELVMKCPHCDEEIYREKSK